MIHLNSFYNKDFEVQDNYCWYINGDISDIIDVIYEFKNQMRIKYKRKFKKIYDEIEPTLKYEYSYVIGIFIYCEDDSENGFTYWVIENYEDKKDAEKYNSDKHYIYRGELKLVNNKLILDTLEMNINKFNL